MNATFAASTRQPPAQMTALQAYAWAQPFLDGDRRNVPSRIEHPRKGWAVALSLNL